VARMNWQRVGQQQRLERWDDYSARAERAENRIVDHRSRGSSVSVSDLAQSGKPGKQARAEALAHALGITTDQLKAVRKKRAEAARSTPVEGVPKAQRATHLARAMGWPLADLEKLQRAERAVGSKRIPIRNPLSARAKETLHGEPIAAAKAAKEKKKAAKAAKEDTKKADLERLRASRPSKTFTSAGKQRPPAKKKTGVRQKKR